MGCYRYPIYIEAGRALPEPEDPVTLDPVRKGRLPPPHVFAPKLLLTNLDKESLERHTTFSMTKI